MTVGGSSLDESSRIFRSAKNNAAIDLLEGASVQMDRSDVVGLSMKAGAEPGLLADFGGILAKEILTNALGDQNDSVRVIEGLTKVRFIGHANAVKNTWARPVAGQSYMTWSAYPTGILLQTDMSADTTVHEVDATIAATVYIMPGTTEKGTGYIHDIWESPDTIDPNGLLAAQATSAVVTTTVTVFLNPIDVPRTIDITPGGTTADVPAGDIIVTGTNYLDEVITEAFTLTANQATLEAGLKAFKTITSVVIPIQDGAGATYDVGWGNTLGLSRPANEVASEVHAALNTTLEGTDPTMVAAGTIEGTTILLNTALNATQVDSWILY